MSTSPDTNTESKASEPMTVPRTAAELRDDAAVNDHTRAGGRRLVDAPEADARCTGGYEDAARG